MTTIFSIIMRKINHKADLYPCPQYTQARYSLHVSSHFYQGTKQTFMELNNFCQCCSIPLDDQLIRGMEKDGSPSADYCKYCYANGAFTNPGLTFEEMQRRLIKFKTQNRLPADFLRAAINRLPHLKRWNEVLAQTG